MTLDVYRGRKTTMQQQQQKSIKLQKYTKGFWFITPDMLTDLKVFVELIK